MRALRLESGAQYKSWESKGFRVVKECIQKLAESLACEVVQQGTQKVTRTDAERWLQQNPTFLKMLAHVFSHLYHYRATTKNPQEDMITIRRKSIVVETNKLLPFCEGIFDFNHFLLIQIRCFSFITRFNKNNFNFIPSIQVFSMYPTIRHSQTFHKCFLSIRICRETFV